ncbi:hypothetical protein GH733_009618, partial [Mirounga leonina]
MHCYCEGPQRNLQRAFNHINVDRSLLEKKNKRHRVDKRGISK